MLIVSIAGLVYACDRFTKRLVVGRLAEGQSTPVFRWLRICHRVNHARVPASRLGAIASAFAFGASVLVLSATVERGYLFQPTAAQVGLGMAFGGAAGNLADRLRGSGVVDFVDVGFWPVFNVADAGISIGAIVALLWIR